MLDPPGCCCMEVVVIGVFDGNMCCWSGDCDMPWLTSGTHDTWGPVEAIEA